MSLSILCASFAPFGTMNRVIGIMHVLMFWGFLMLSTDMFDLATANWVSGEALTSALVGPWNGMVELGYTMGLVG